MGEFDGVAGEIDQNLLQTSQVTNKPVGDIGGDVPQKLKILFVSAGREGLHRLAQGLAKFEFMTVEFQLARLDLGKVQDVIDDSQK